MTCWPVSTRVGNVKNNDPSLIEPDAPYLPQINDHACRAIDLYETGFASNPVRRQSPLR
jgi:hypothetical protein